MKTKQMIAVGLASLMLLAPALSQAQPAGAGGAVGGAAGMTTATANLIGGLFTATVFVAAGTAKTGGTTGTH